MAEEAANTMRIEELLAMQQHHLHSGGGGGASTPTRGRARDAESSEDDDRGGMDEETDDGNDRKRGRPNGTPQGRAKKPHLQGRFSGRLPTKEDEKRLAEECRLLGPMLGGSGKRGDKSRLTLAKIVRGIASGEIRRFCEDREKILQEARRIVSMQKQQGGVDIMTMQQEIDMLRKDSDAKAQKIMQLEKQLGMAKTNSSGPGTSAFAAGAHSGGLGGSGSALGQQGLSPQAMQQQLSDLASQHRAAMLQAKACFTQVQTMSLEQSELEMNMNQLQAEVNKLVQRREELSADEVARLRLLDSELSKVQLQFQRNSKLLQEMREAAIRAESQATVHAQNHNQLQHALDLSGGSKSLLGSAGLFSDTVAAAVQQAQQNHGQWSLQTAPSALDFTSQVRMLEAGSGPPFGPRISLLDSLTTPRISLLDPLTSAPSLPLGGGTSLTGGRLSASQLDIRAPAFYTLNMVPSSNGVGPRLSQLGHQVAPVQSQMAMPVFQLGSLRNLGQVGMGMDGLGAMQGQTTLELPSGAGALGQLTSAWGTAALTAAAAAVGGGGGLGSLVARGSSGSGSTMFGAVMGGQAGAAGGGAGGQAGGGAGGQAGAGALQGQGGRGAAGAGQQNAALLSLGGSGGGGNQGPNAAVGRLQLTGDGLPSGAAASLGLNLALPATRPKVEA